jgi:hypothetical protein
MTEAAHTTLVHIARSSEPMMDCRHPSLRGYHCLSVRALVREGYVERVARGRLVATEKGRRALANIETAARISAASSVREKVAILKASRSVR